MKSSLIGFFATTLALVSIPATEAHHAFSAEFDSNRPVTLEGSITRVEWINPHGWIHVAVTNDDGNVENWMIEMGSVGTLVRRGVTRDSIPVGTEVVISGFQARNGSNRASGDSITTRDGERLIVGSAGVGAAPGRE